MDLFPEKVSPYYSENWDITYHGTYKVLTNLHSDKSYLLYHCGTEPPENVEDFHVVVEVPIQQAVVTSTTQIPNLELLGKRTSIAAYVGNRQYVSSPCINELMDEGIVENVASGSD